MDVVEFFQLCTGTWRSQRTTHHLAFKLTETGESEIQVEALVANHPQVIEICELHQVDPNLSIGGAHVSWKGGMGWDKEDENHEGSTVLVLIPDTDLPQEGTLLRERGYAENVPISGRYRMDDGDGLVLTTEYEIMRSVERFWFASPNLRLRTSTVQLNGGFTTATFSTELRIVEASRKNPSQDKATFSKSLA